MQGSWRHAHCALVGMVPTGPQSAAGRAGFKVAGMMVIGFYKSASCKDANGVGYGICVWLWTGVVLMRPGCNQPTPILCSVSY